MATVKKNQIIKTNITDLTDLGFGVGRVDGAVIFISDTVPGDEVEAKVIKVNSSYLVGRVEKFIKKSPLRVCDRCTEVGCKSCAYRSISYAEELNLKGEGVRRLFATEELKHIRVAEVIGSPAERRYRNKAQYPITRTKDGYAVGFFAPKSHRVTPVGDCPLTPEVFSDICRELVGFFAEHSISVYDEATGEGLLRHVYLRRGEVSSEILVTLVINGDSLPHADRLVDLITGKHPETVGILLNINREDTNVVLGDKFITLYGRDHIFDTLAGVRLKIAADAFYQVNHGGAELLYAKAKELAAPEKTDTLLDLYCGAGSIGLSMADAAGELFGIEIVPSAVECARENATASGITNAKFFTGDAKNASRMLETAERELKRPIRPDVVILDPPRAGCDEELLRFVASLAPRKIVYISCNPKTLARDITRLIPLGYNTNEVTPVDMFPCTGHVETIVCLCKQ